MKSLFRKFLKSKDGVVSVEFAMIAPTMIFATLFAINMGYKVNKHQKLSSSITAGTNYIQDYFLENSMDELRPNYDQETGKVSDTHALATMKSVIQEAYEGNLETSEIYVNTYCACPNNKEPDESSEPIDGSYTGAIEGPDSERDFDFSESDKEFYTKTRVSLWKKGELCGYDCPNQGGRARVLTDVEIYHVTKDLFGKQTIIREKLKVRMR